MRLKTFCSLSIIPTLILVLLLLSTLDNYSIPSDSYGQPLDDGAINQTDIDAFPSNTSVAASTILYNGTATE